MAKYIFGNRQAVVLPADKEYHFAQISLENQDPAIFIVTSSTIDLSILIDTGMTLGNQPYYTILGEKISPAEIRGIVPLFVCNRPNKDILDYYYQNYALNRETPLSFSIFYGIKPHIFYAILNRLVVTNTTESDFVTFSMELILINKEKYTSQYTTKFNKPTSTSKPIINHGFNITV